MIIDESSEGAQDYYAYGEILRRYYSGGNLNDKYKFTEKERDTETNYDYFGARYYDSELGIWRSVDPLKDMYPGLSPYVYTANNPLRYVDPTGMSYEDLKSTAEGVHGRMANNNIIDGTSITVAGDKDDKKKKNNNNSSSTVGKIGVAAGVTQEFVVNKLDKAMISKMLRQKYWVNQTTTYVKYGDLIYKVKSIGGVITVGLTGYSIWTDIENDDWSQAGIDAGILGLTFISPPIGIGLSFYDQTLGIKNTFNYDWQYTMFRLDAGKPIYFKAGKE